MAETNGLLNRRTGKSGTEGSNPSVSATSFILARKTKGIASPCGLRPTFQPSFDLRCISLLRVTTATG